MVVLFNHKRLKKFSFFFQFGCELLGVWICFLFVSFASSLNLYVEQNDILSAGSECMRVKTNLVFHPPPEI